MTFTHIFSFFIIYLWGPDGLGSIFQFPDKHELQSFFIHLFNQK